MTDRADKLRAEVAKYLRLAQTAKDPNVRAQLTAMAERSLALTQRTEIDLEALLNAYDEGPVARAEAALHQQQQQQPPSDTAADDMSPTCPGCGKVMRLERSSPDIRYANLDQLRYVCDCGGVAEKMVAHKD